MGDQNLIAEQINRSERAIVDFGGETLRIDGPIVLDKLNAKWRLVSNLSVEVEGDEFVALEIPRWAGTMPHRRFQMADFRRPDGARVGTAIRARPTGLTFDGLQIRGFKVGVAGQGLNLARFLSSRFEQNAIDVLWERDELVTGRGYVGNDARFIGCDFRQHTEFGFLGVRNTIEIGGSPGNNLQFTNCLFETTQPGATLMRLEAGYYSQITGGRFECRNALAGLRLVGAQKARVRGALFAGTRSFVIEAESSQTRIRDNVLEPAAGGFENYSATTFARGNIGIPDLGD